MTNTGRHLTTDPGDSTGLVEAQLLQQHERHIDIRAWGQT